MTPAQQIAIARVVTNAAQYALAVKYIANEVIDNPDLQYALADPKGATT